MSHRGEINLINSDIYDDGCLRVDHTKFYVSYHDKPLYNLTPKEFQILSRLVRESGRPVPQTALWAAAWGEKGAFDDQAGKMLRVYISTLRRKIKHFGLCILAKPSIGYVLSTNECLGIGHKDGPTQ
jgi:DNA-binding response OmpR family regulator